MNREIRILHLEDDTKDAELVAAHLDEKGVLYTRVLTERRETFEAALRDSDWDVVLSDYKLPDYDGMAALRITRAHSEFVPFIFISGAMGEELAVESLKGGASDYILKDNLKRLVPAIFKAIEESEHERDRMRLYRDLAFSESKFRALLENSIDGILLGDPDGNIFFANRAACEMFRMTQAEICRVGRSGIIDPTDSRLDELLSRRSAKGTATAELRFVRAAGGIFPGEVTSSLYSIGDNEMQAGMIIRDITEHLLLHEENLRLEEKFRHAQKLEAVGRLAGGVAHDFNNLLGVILGYAGLALARVEMSDPIYPFLKEILEAGHRSTELTRQLLTFARKQTIAPKRLDIDAHISRSEKMIRRMVGEDVELKILHETALWPMFMDPSQVDQILTNLAVNSRDAIRGIGEITIKTGNRSIEQSFCSSHPGMHPGDYVQLSFSDNGSGMDSKTMSRIFEPFFTTKEEGKGTGLGLATVYGIVKQNNGYIDVRSRPGAGTTFDIFFPRATGDCDVAEDEGDASPPSWKGTETILVVEDEQPLLTLCDTMLKALGYKVFTAKSPDEAVRICREPEEPISLLLTDIVMPGMNGKQLMEQVKALQPGIKVLLMSGYAEAVLEDRGLAGLDFVQKPLSLHALSIAMRKSLDGSP